MQTPILRPAKRAPTFTARILTLLTLGVLSLGSLQAQVSLPSFSYQYQGASVALGVRMDRALVRSVSKDPATARRSLAGLALVDQAQVEPHPIPGWYTIHIPTTKHPALRSLGVNQAGTLHSINTLIAHVSSVAYATPVFTTAEGEMIPTGDLLVWFSPAYAKLKIAIPFPSQVIDRELLYTSRAGTCFRLKTNLKTGIEALELVKQVRQMPGVMCADADCFCSCTSETMQEPHRPMVWGPDSRAWALKNTGQNGGIAGVDLGATLEVFKARAPDVYWGKNKAMVVVMDCGVDHTHPDLSVVAGRDFTGQNIPDGMPNLPNMPEIHGTQLAGCINGSPANLPTPMRKAIPAALPVPGATGAAPTASIASARISFRQEIKTTTNVTNATNPSSAPLTSSFVAPTGLVSAIQWTKDLGSRVICTATTIHNRYDSIDQAVAAARSDDILFFGATGNDKLETKGRVAYPASLEAAVAVSAFNHRGEIPVKFNTGKEVKFLAPGWNNYTTVPGGGYAMASGTSLSSAFASAVAANLFMQNPTWSAQQVLNRMIWTCTDYIDPTDLKTIGPDDLSGAGRLRADRALDQKLLIEDRPERLAQAINANAPPYRKEYSLASGTELSFKFKIDQKRAIRIETISRISSTKHFSSYAALDAVLKSYPSKPEIKCPASDSRNFRLDTELEPGLYYLVIKAQPSTFLTSGNTFELSIRYRDAVALITCDSPTANTVVPNNGTLTFERSALGGGVNCRVTNVGDQLLSIYEQQPFAMTNYNFLVKLGKGTPAPSSELRQSPEIYALTPGESFEFWIGLPALKPGETLSYPSTDVEFTKPSLGTTPKGVWQRFKLQSKPTTKP